MNDDGVTEMSGFRLGDSAFHFEERAPRGSIVELDGATFHRIDDVDGMAPFLMSVVSGGDRWMYVASSGGLTAGRRNPNGALFPYETDDRLLAIDGTAGPRTVLFVERAGVTWRWEPFLRAPDGLYPVRRALWKSTLGNQICFEERNEALGLTIRSWWCSGERFGFVRRVQLHNDGDETVRIRILDGLVALMPACVDRGMQASFSTLVDAYKQAELLEGSDLALFRLSSIPIDSAIPNEALLANVGWVRGLPEPRLLLSTRQLEAFRHGRDVAVERTARGLPGALLAVAETEIAPGETKPWIFGLDAGLDARQVVALANQIGPGPEIDDRLQTALTQDLAEDRARLQRLVAEADGLQVTADPVEDARHTANTLFNVMRGGTFLHGGRVDRDDFSRYLAELAPRLAARVSLDDWPATCSRGELVERAVRADDVDLERLAREYLPLTFSRRHGDPSRPWNDFHIVTHGPDGEPRLRYEGNWRDIFQNWEALLRSYPAFVEAAVVKFVNGTTADGFNPYRVAREGLDWEVPDPADPWANIGYWGDHQVIYLQRLLDLAERIDPGGLADLLRRPIFVFANVPYRLASYENLLADPHQTIAFDARLDASIKKHVPLHGNEARLATTRPLDGDEPTLCRAGLAEKLLIPILAKLSHFIPDLGIWMNTQRPEWNDANNALVGRGVSVVTAGYLARHVETVRRVFDSAGDAPFSVSSAAARHLRETSAVLSDGKVKAGSMSPRERRDLLDGLGRSGSRYRDTVYRRLPACRERQDVAAHECRELLDAAHTWLLATVRANVREDRLVHAYNLLQVEEDGGLEVRRLPIMLEGQVAGLVSGAFSAAESADLLDGLAASALRREDLGTYVLYPDRELPSFLQKGVIAPHEIEACEPLGVLLDVLLEAGEDRIVRRDQHGCVRFAPGLNNIDALDAALRAVAKDVRFADVLGREREALRALYVRTFAHTSFMGRSTVFFGYEGLGCAYWHMVSKLRLAVVETWLDATRTAADETVLDRLRHHYQDIRRGLGTGADPATYGAFPSDPYSHTPAHAGARQPGMTGQVKEDLIARGLEMGVGLDAGRIRFGSKSPSKPEPLPKLRRARIGLAVDCEVPPGSVAFSVCGVPVLWRNAGGALPQAEVVLRHGARVTVPGAHLDRALSRSIFDRTGEVLRIEVG